MNLLVQGIALGAVRFILEVLDKTRHFDSFLVSRVMDLNFLHYAILMFVLCAAVLVGVSFLYPAPDRKKLAGLTLAAVEEKLQTTRVRTKHLERETEVEHTVNLAFTGLLLATVVGLWIYFR